MASSASNSEDIRERTQQSPLASRRIQPPTVPTAKPPSKLGQLFPLGYKESVTQWWGSISPATAEHNVLSYIPYLRVAPTHTQTGTETTSDEAHPMKYDANPARAATPERTDSTNEHGHDPFGPRLWRSLMVPLSGKNRALNEFSVEREGEQVEENFVMLHGYGAGLGFFYKNFEGLSRVQGLKLYALDMLGMGRSTRPSFKVHAKDPKGKIAEAEAWFVDALEEWRVKRGIEKFTLMGHSMGGYMAVAYALKYPGRLNKLILASPVGIPEDPYAVQDPMPDTTVSGVENEMLQDQENDVINVKSSSGGGTPPQSAAGATPREPPKRPIPKWLHYLWEANISPFSIVRWTGPLGPRFVSGWTSRRFSHLPEQEAQALHDYAYSLFRQRGSGEYALAYILAPGAFARSPLIRRIAGVGRQQIPATSDEPARKETGLPVVMLYGSHDWMDIKGGYAAVEKLKEAREKALATATAAEKAKENGDARVVVIDKAGHHLYLDGWEEFNQVVRAELESTKRDIKRRKALDENDMVAQQVKGQL